MGRRGTISYDQMDEKRKAGLDRRAAREKHEREQAEAIRLRDQRRASRGWSNNGGAMRSVNSYADFNRWLSGQADDSPIGVGLSRAKHPYLYFLATMGITLTAIGKEEMVLIHPKTGKVTRTRMALWLVQFVHRLDTHPQIKQGEMVRAGLCKEIMAGVVPSKQIPTKEKKEKKP